MAYSTNPYLPKARAAALKLLICDQLPVGVVALRAGVHRSTIWRWKRKWDALNRHVQMDNPNRPNRRYSRQNHLARCMWRIPTESSRPHTSPHALPPAVVEAVVHARKTLQRCAEVVWYYVRTVHGLTVSLSSVRRILSRHGLASGRRPRLLPDNPPRPLVSNPGELVQTDTIHHVDPHTGRRLYYYTVIDLWSRLSYVEAHPVLRPGLAANVVLRAQERWRDDGFTSISMVQCDNGPEFGCYFAQELERAAIQVRHSRLGRPNDNAHIERFNRTLQEECVGHYWRRSVPLHRQRERLSRYIDFYNNERIHLGIQMRVPREMLQRL